MTIRASTPRFCRLRRIRCTPSSMANGFVRDDPRIVPPRGSNPRTAGMSSGIVAASSGPRHPSRNPRKE
jgi:hypothetical protein